MTKKNTVSLEMLYEHLRSKNFDTEEEMKTYIDTMIGKSAEDILKINNSPKLKAMHLLEKASWEKSDTKYHKYINEALLLDPDNADAYMMLADDEEDEDKYAVLIEKAIEAGKKSIGDEYDSLIGNFWMHSHTRPYMRALARKGDLLRNPVNSEEAITVYQLILKLNPNDNQGIRDLLAPILIYNNKKTEYKKLVTQFLNDDSLSFHICNAFLAWKESPKSPRTITAFKELFLRNTFLAELLFGGNEDLPELPEMYSIGSPEEAIYSIYTCGLLFSDSDEELTKLMINVIMTNADTIEVMQESWMHDYENSTQTRFYIKTAFSH
ncbi:MAG: hypothetical protein MUC87_02660 [Bacteroidia bacterium]|jgi:tetratricopeptide (TPR) repeat protein|nr:hypothetical protein [Bacteroidia bacterium]